ncbi:MAG: hypothetical protein K0S04_878 [Herbinix sp.]|jgi:4-hydroxybenzoate polyprenyltransferase|nr:hypothetical protein [Herbinix sp.]
MKWKKYFLNIVLVLMIVSAVLTAMLYDRNKHSTVTVFIVMGALYLIIAIAGSLILIKKRSLTTKQERE